MDRSQCFDEVQPVRLVWSIDVATIQSRVRDAYHVKAVLSTSTVMSRFNCLVNGIHLSIYKYSSYPPFENKNNTIIERLAEGEKKGIYPHFFKTTTGDHNHHLCTPKSVMRLRL